MKALVLLSGGLDSSVCLGLAVKEYGAGEVLALSVFYGQKHDKELKAAEDIASYYGVRRLTLDLGEIFKDSDCTLLTGSKEEIPHEEYAKQLEMTGGAPVSTYVPFRNGLFLSSAASVALANGCEVIYYGAHADDAAGHAYPDCTPEFITAMQESIYQGTGHKVMMQAPWWDKNKAAVVKAGLDLGMTHEDFEHTWSCYEGKDTPCGTCGTCIDRKAAFEANGITDIM